MPIERIPAAEAFERLRENPDSRWPDGRKRGERLLGVAQVGVKPRFQFARNTPILTIGSCFARNIETHLAGLGFDLPMTAVSVPREERFSETANDILNKYSVHSIENEIRWAFEGAPQMDGLFLETEDGLWHDPQLAPNLTPASLERVKERRADVIAATRQMARCGLVIITLGLAESWFDLRTNLYLNGAPPPASLKRYPNRFALDVLSHDEILQSLERIRGLVKRYARPDAKILITTSPVPFKATFTGEDAITANTYSKAVQRAACRAFSANRTDVDYFPSYEVVTLTDRTTAFEIDNIHVRAPVVAEIMHRVLTAYCPEAAGGPDVDAVPDDPRLHEKLVNAIFKEGDYERAARGYGDLLRRHGQTMHRLPRGRVRTSQGVAYLRARQTALGVAALREALMDAPLDARLHYKLGLGHARLDQREQAVEHFENALRLNPEEPDHAWRLGLVLAEDAANDPRAKNLFEQALALNPEHAGARGALQAYADGRRPTGGDRADEG